MSIKVKKILLSVVAVVGLIAIIVALFFAVYGIVMSVNAGKYDMRNISEYKSGDGSITRVHFLNTGGSDAIILESGGRFGMIDAGEDNDNPRNLPALNLKGFEDSVIAYIKKNCIVDGVPKLEFIIGTHAHSDHIGGVDSVINDSAITVDTLYLKKYYEDRINDYEVEKWDNKEVYEQAINAANSRSVKIVQNLVDYKIRLGDFDITIYNGEEATVGAKVGENENSLAILAEAHGKKLLFAGDMNNYDGDEVRVGKAIGKVDLLKLGHHGLEGSTGTPFVKAVKPDLCIQTAFYPPLFQISFDLAFIAGAPIFQTATNDGIIVTVGDKLELYNKIH